VDQLIDSIGVVGSVKGQLFIESTLRDLGDCWGIVRIDFSEIFHDAIADLPFSRT
jgi:hypothetical protein